MAPEAKPRLGSAGIPTGCLLAGRRGLPAPRLSTPSRTRADRGASRRLISPLSSQIPEVFGQ